MLNVITLSSRICSICIRIGDVLAGAIVPNGTILTISMIRCSRKEMYSRARVQFRRSAIIGAPTIATLMKQSLVDLVM